MGSATAAIQILQIIIMCVKNIVTSRSQSIEGHNMLLAIIVMNPHSVDIRNKVC